MIGDQSLGAMVAVLLAEATTTIRMPVVEENVDTIVLSRSAARAAARSQHVDPSTEMLELASHISRRCSAHAQVHSMTIVSKVVQCALLHVADVADIQISDEMLEEVTEEDRKSVVQGTSVSVRVDLGGRRIIKKKKRIQKELK